MSQGLILVLVCSLPWWFGGVQPSAQFVCSLTVLVAAIFMCCAQVMGSSEQVALPRGMLLVLLAALALGAFQLLPLPHRILRVIAPENATLWQQLTPVNEQRADMLQVGLETGYWSQRNAWPISLYAASGKHDLSLLCVAVGVFFIGVFQFSSDRAVRTLLISVALCGATFGFFGVAQQLIWNGKIYGQVPLSNGGLPFAAFVNRNNAGGFLNLCLAACLGLLVGSFAYLYRRRSIAANEVVTKAEPARETPHSSVESTAQKEVRAKPSTPQYAGAPSQPSKRTMRTMNRKGAWREILANVSGLQVLAGLSSVMVLGAVMCTLSRGAMLACLLSIPVLAFASGRFVQNRWLNGFSWLLLAFGGAGLAAWVGRVDDIQLRAESMALVISHPDGRLGHWRDSLAAAADFWLLGTGFGTQRFIYRLYESFPTDAWFFHAENQYVEAFVEGGWLGLSLLLTAIGLTFVACWQLIRKGADTIDYVVGLVGLFAISTQSIHAFFDFGLYVPSNMCLLALICGVVHGRNARRYFVTCPVNPVTIFQRFRLALTALLAGRAAGASVATAMCAFLAVATVNLLGYARADAAIRSLPQDSTDVTEIGRDPDVVQRLEIASQIQPHDVEARLRVAQAWIDRYRHAAWKSRVAAQPNADPNQLWALTSPAEVHTFVRLLEQSGRTIELEDFRASRAVCDNLVPAVRHLLAARAACPLLPEIHLLLSELQPIMGANADAGQDLQRVAICAPRGSQLLAEAGLVAMVDSQPSLAAALWRQAGTVDPQRLPALLRLAAFQPVMRNHLREILPQDSVLLVRAARESFLSNEDHELRTLITNYAKETLPEAKIDDAQRWHLEGVLFMLVNEPEAAIEPLTKATRAKPLEVAWRFDLATALAENGMTDQARDHASFCVRMEPNNEHYKALLKRLIRTSLSSR